MPTRPDGAWAGRIAHSGVARSRRAADWRFAHRGAVVSSRQQREHEVTAVVDPDQPGVGIALAGVQQLAIAQHHDDAVTGGDRGGHVGQVDAQTASACAVGNGRAS